LRLLNRESGVNYVEIPAKRASRGDPIVLTSLGLITVDTVR
jgi:hypothetical protein